MKKLLIAMMSVAAFACAARADYVEDSVINSTDFETLEIGSDLNVNRDDSGTDVGDKYWTFGNGEEEDAPGTIVEVTGTYVGDLTLGEKALAVDADKRLSRKVNSDGNARAIDDGIFFDSLVQFTASDTAPTLEMESENVPADKLIVWLYAGTDGDCFGATTNLMIMASNLDEETHQPAGVSQFMVLGDISQNEGINVEPDSWHRLTIKASTETWSNDPSVDDYNTYFTVYIDGKEVWGWDTDNDEAPYINKYLSMRPRETTNHMAISSVSFQGKGMVDQLAFLSVDPFAPPVVAKFVMDLQDEEVVISSMRYAISTATTPGDYKDVDWDGDGFMITEWDLLADDTEIAFEAYMPDGYEIVGWECVASEVDTDSEEMIYCWAKTYEFADLDLVDGEYTVTVQVQEVATEPETVSFTINVPAGWTIQYDLGDGLVAYDSATGAECLINTSVRIVITNGDGITKEFNEVVETAEQDILLNDEDIALAWEDYLGDAVEGAYQIADEDDLFMFLKGVNNAQLDTTDKTFVLTDNITMTTPWPGIGVYGTNGSALSFRGVFDGNNKKISNVVFANGENNQYRGFFNQVWGGTVKNLTVATTGFESGTTGKYGCAAIAGHVGVGTLENCTAEGNFFGTHNVGGVVIRTNGTLVKNCTNNADVSGTYTKVAGIVVLDQNASSSRVGAGTVIEGCVNNGSVTIKAGGSDGSDGVGGIIGWNGDYTSATIKNCTNNGAVTAEAGVSTSTLKLGQIVGFQNGYAKIQGTIVGRADTIAAYDNKWDLKYATIEGNVATFVKAADLEAGKEYRIMVKGLEPEFALGEGESISFDCALLDAVIEGTSITLNEALDEEAYEITPATAGNVITFTAQAKAADEGFDAGSYEDVDEMLENMSSASDILVTGEASMEMVVTGLDGVKTITFGEKVATIPAYYNVAVNNAGNGFKLDLNDLAKPIISEAEIEDEVKPALEVVDGKFVVTLTEGYENLRYSLWEADTPTGTFTKVEGSQKAGAATFQLEAPTNEASTKFYKVVVTDIRTK